MGLFGVFMNTIKLEDTVVLLLIFWFPMETVSRRVLFHEMST